MCRSGIKWWISGTRWEIKKQTVMLIGEYTHTLDDKKRISLPVKFRKTLGKKVIITKGLDNCLFLYPLPQWEKITEELGTLSFGRADSRSFNRFMLSGASEVPVDSAGRILISDNLKDFAKLDDKAVITGVGNRIEIWNTSLWEDYKKRIEKDADVLAEKLGEVGMI